MAVQYGITIIEYDADMNAVRSAVADLLVGDQPTDSNQVYVAPESVGDAVSLINELGYTTDEDDDQA